MDVRVKITICYSDTDDPAKKALDGLAKPMELSLYVCHVRERHSYNTFEFVSNPCGQVKKPSTSEHDSTEDELIKSKRIEQPSEEKFLSKTEVDHQANSEKSLEKGKQEKPSDKVVDEKRDVVLGEHKSPAEPDVNSNLHLIKENASQIVKPNINPAEEPRKKTSDSVPCCPKAPREKIIRNQSDILSLKDDSSTFQTSIFSINGSPSRKVFRKHQPAGHVFQKNDDPPSDQNSTPRGSRITKENYNDEKRPSSSYRNPITGTGLTSSDEYKSKGTKRRDGNPVLGLGYDGVAVVPTK